MAIEFDREDGVSLRPDAVTEIDYSTGATVTDVPIEDGARVTDSVKRNPRALAFRVVMSSTPRSTAQDARNPRRRQEAAAFFEDALDGLLFDIRGTVRGTFPLCACESIAYGDRGTDTWTFDVRFRQLTIGYGTTVKVPPTAPRPAHRDGYADKADVGEQPTKEVTGGQPAAEQDKSWLVRLTGG